MTILSRKNILGCGAAVAVLALATAALAQQRTFDIPAQDATRAAPEFARQAGVQIIAPGNELRGVRTRAVRGEHDVRAALAIMLQGTGLVVASDDGSVITLRRASSLPQEQGAAVSPATAVDDIVVTGTRIRGANPTVPLRIVDREELDQSGQSDIGAFMRSLPEAFGGGQNPGVMTASSSVVSNNNASNASTVNLRGLGGDATLVLINGRRLSGDMTFQAADISSIPFDALERIEILKDGASAIYGSDAVAGVVNFVLRRDFDGAVLRSRLGVATQGGGEEQTYSALLGRAGDRWRAMANVEYGNQRGVRANQREFTSEMYPDNTLSRPQERISVVTAGGVDLSSSLSLSFEGLYSERSSSSAERGSPAAQLVWHEMDTVARVLALTLEQRFENGWRAAVSGVTADSTNEWIGNGPSSIKRGNTSRYVEVTTDGRLGWISGRDVRVALGGGFRHEEYFNFNRRTQTTTHDVNRDIRYLFAEALVPILPPSENRPGLHAVDLSVSGRYEHYSDFGETTNPRVGLRVAPSPDVNLRATWGTSFKAPTFFQLYSQSQLVLFPASSFGQNIPGTGLMTAGGNPNLQPERSESWTASIDYTPQSIPSLLLSATYFHIDYIDRVVVPVLSFGRALIDPVYAPFVTMNPSPELQQQLMTAADVFLNQTGAAYDPSTVVLLVENMNTNSASQIAQGVDLAYRQAFDLPLGRIDTFANATWLGIEQQTSALSEVEELTGVLNNPPDLRARGGASWSSGGWRVTGAVNYMNGFLDNVTVPNVRIGAWTTVDANLEYRFQDDQAWTSGLRLNLSATNLFDRDPPFVLGASRIMAGQYYDSTKTSPVGRVVHFQITKSW